MYIIVNGKMQFKPFFVIEKSNPKKILTVSKMAWDTITGEEKLFLHEKKKYVNASDTIVALNECGVN